MRAIRPELDEFKKTLPPGYQMQVGGEEESQIDGFKNLSLVMAISIAATFLALVFQFKNAVKPLLVFAGIPYGMVVSHIIVLFEFIEERHALGRALSQGHAGFRYPPATAGADHCGRHRYCALPLGISRRAAVGQDSRYQGWSLSR